MRYDQTDIREMLAAEYAMGSLRGAALLRYEKLLRNRRDWQQSAAWWSDHVHLLADTVTATPPPKRVWQKIEHRLYGRQQAATSDVWWKRIAMGSSTAAIALAFVVASNVLHKPEPVIVQPAPSVAEIAQAPSIAVLTDPQAKSAWLLALNKNDDGSTEIRATALAGIASKPKKSFELWMLPSDKSKPVSLGLLPQSGQIRVNVSVALSVINSGNGLAVSLEPKGGSPSGQPTGPIMYQGKLTQL